MQSKLSDSLKRVLSSSDSDSSGSDDDEPKRPKQIQHIDVKPAPEPISFLEIAMNDIELEERIGIGNASTIFKGIWKVSASFACLGTFLKETKQGKIVAVKQYITYSIRQIQDGVMRAFNYEKKMMKCGIRMHGLVINRELVAGC